MSEGGGRPRRSSLLRFAEDVTGTLATRVLTMGFGLFTGVITARALGPENRGVFALAALFPASLVTLSKLGQSQATIYFIRKEKADVSQVVSNVVYIALTVGVLLVLSALLLRETILATVLRGVPLWCLTVVLPLVPILLLESYLYGLLQATDRFRVYNTRLLLEAMGTLSFMAVALLWLKLGLAGALGVAVGVRTVMTGWVLWTVHRGTPLRLRFDTELFGRMIRYGLKSHVQIIASHFHFKAGVYLVAYFMTPVQVAFFAIAERLAEHIMYVPQALGVALFPRLAGSKVERVHELTAQACRQNLVVTGAIAFSLAVLGRWLIPAWYGVDYAPAAGPLPYVAWGIVMMSLYVLLSRNFTSRNKQQVNIFAGYVALGGNIVLNILLIPRYGIIGAATATAISYTVSAAILLLFFLRESGLRWHEPLILRPSDVAMWVRAFREFIGERRVGKTPPGPLGPANDR